MYYSDSAFAIYEFNNQEEVKMKIEEAVKRLSNITYVGEEYDTARKALLFWKKLRDSMKEQEVNEFGGQAFIGVSRITSIIEKYIWEIEREQDADSD